MTLTTNTTSPSTSGLSPAVSDAIASFKHLSVDDQLGLLWVIYQSLGCSFAPSTPGAARLFLTQGLLHRLKQMPTTEQLPVLHDLLTGTDTPITRQYGMFVPNTKLAFWSQLFEWMYAGEIVPEVVSYKLSPTARQLFRKIASLDYSEQIQLVRQVILDMGIEPIAA